MSYFIYQESETYGPYPLEQLRALWAEGRVQTGALFCEEGAEEWRDIAELRSRLEPQPRLPAAVRASPPLPVQQKSAAPRKNTALVAAGVVGLFAFFIIIGVVSQSTTPTPVVGGRSAAAGVMYRCRVGASQRRLQPDRTAIESNFRRVSRQLAGTDSSRPGVIPSQPASESRRPVHGGRSGAPSRRNGFMGEDPCELPRHHTREASCLGSDFRA